MPRKYQKKTNKGQYGEFKRERERIAKKYEWWQGKYQELCDYCDRMKLKEVDEAFKLICVQKINEWYDAYTPFLYKRKYGLKGIPTSSYDLDELSFEYEFSPNGIWGRHRVSKDYLFENSFMGGWHGGADKLTTKSPKFPTSIPHPEPGVPYWRWPSKDIYEMDGNGKAIGDENGMPVVQFQKWQLWYEHEAAWSIPPAWLIYDEFVNRTVPEIVQKYDDIFDKRFDEISNELLYCIKQNYKGW